MKYIFALILPLISFNQLALALDCETVSDDPEVSLSINYNSKSISFYNNSDTEKIPCLVKSGYMLCESKDTGAKAIVHQQRAILHENFSDGTSTFHHFSCPRQKI